MPDKVPPDAPPLSRDSKGESGKGRVVVTLSSVAKTPPPLGPSTISAASREGSALAVAPSRKAAGSRETVSATPGKPPLNRTMEVMLPPKSGVLPKLTRLNSLPVANSSRAGVLPPPVELPKMDAASASGTGAEAPSSAQDETASTAATALQPKRVPAFRLKPFRPAETSEGMNAPEPPPLKPPGWKHMMPGEIAPLAAKSEEATLPPSSPALSAASPKPDALHVAPPLLDSPGAESVEKLRLPPPLRKTESLPSIQKAPALVDPVPAALLPPPAGIPFAGPTSTAEPVPVALAKAPAWSEPSSARRTAPPLPIGGAPRKETVPPPVPLSEPGSGTPPPLPRLVSALNEPPAEPPVLPSSSDLEPKPAATLKSKLKPLSTEDSFLQQAELLIVDPEKGPSSWAALKVDKMAETSPAPKAETPAPPATAKEDSFILSSLPAKAVSAPPTDQNRIEPAPLPPSVEARAMSPAKVEPSLPVPAQSPTTKPGQEPLPPASPQKKSVVPLLASTALSARALRQASAEAKPESAALPPPIPPVSAAQPSAPVPPAGPVKPSRSARLRKKELVGTVIFYAFFLIVIIPGLFFLGLHFSSETSVKGQVIPPPGTLLSNEVWVVSDFREMASSIADDLAADRAPKLQEIQERQDHVQRAQADIAAREERIRLLQDQITEAKDEIESMVKQARADAQKVWDGPGAALEDEYRNRLAQLQQSIAARANSLHLNYTPDNTYESPEVWANAYRLALYQTPPGVDGVKEHAWIEDQLTQWRNFTKTFDDRKDKLRLQAAQIQLSPTAKVTDLNSQIDDLNHRIESTQAEEEPLKTELQQAKTDLAEARAKEANLDAAYYQQLYKLPEQSITKRLPLRPNGRFDWLHLEKDSAFSQSEKSHSYWLFSRAVRKDGRQFWVLAHFSITQNSNVAMLIEPASFISTKAILRPDLSADEQQE